MRLVILGGPGAGKGTQARQLCRQLNVVGISTSDMLRQAIASQTELGLEAQPYVEKGELVPDEILIEFMRQRLLQPDVGNGWVLEGYPRTAFQAEELDFLLEELEQRLDWAIYLEVLEAVMVSRSSGRAYTPEGMVPTRDLRPDDQPEILQRRIGVFSDRIPTLLEYYGYCQRLLTINGDQSPEQVQQHILQKLGI
ncbi:MAG: nucleoside monophosphate kinase [Coleofasciculus sp. S288]|nr:nucleoside monophosphate kinase [Coleofasciculus sp. S288]